MNESPDTSNVDKSLDIAGPTAAVQHAGANNYLGNPEVVSMLIRKWIDKAVERRNGETGPQFAAAEGAEVRELARIFLGKDPNYIPVGEFNKPGGIDQFLREHEGVKDTDPENAVANTLLAALWDVLSILGKYDGQPVDLWGWQIQGRLEDYEQLFLGVPLVQEPEPA